MKRDEIWKCFGSSSSARMLGAILLMSATVIACGDEEAATPGNQQVTPGGETTSAVCGNGVIEIGEACDRAALPAGAPATVKCKEDCSGLELCGNGKIDLAESEECDFSADPQFPGWVVGSNLKCLESCVIQMCGNNRIDGDEECDGSIMPETAHLNARCEGCKIAKCGNGALDDGEACDINLPSSIPDDSTCQADCTLQKKCGNGVRDAGEKCDPKDPDVSLYLAEGETCLDDCTTQKCGNNLKEGTEECDGTDTPSERKCLDTCKLDPCGDGEISGTEECDLSAAPALPDTAHANATCLENCTIQKCGNGEIDAGEACDPNATPALPPGTTEGSVCLPNCTVRAPDCGNGRYEPDKGEECDPNTNAGGTPAFPPGSSFTNDQCLANCTLKVCGNHRIDGDEECDSEIFPNTLPASAAGTAKCTNTCTIVPCGNGVIDQGETCDLGAALPAGALEGSVCQEGCVLDQCPQDVEKLEPGQCGCGVVEDTGDDDGDGVMNCKDACPSDEWKKTSTEASESECGCGKTKVEGACYLNINTAAELIALTPAAPAILKKDINLGDALTVSERKAVWAPLFAGSASNAYQATFLGDGKKITATDAVGGDRITLTCKNASCGLFARIGSNETAGAIQNLTLDFDMEANSGLADTTETAGLLVGRLHGSKLSDIHAAGALTFRQGSKTDASVGGLVGTSSDGDILDSSSSVAVKFNASDDGNVAYVGGFVGDLAGTSYNAWATGAVSFTGAIKARVGGLAGLLLSSGVVTNAYALGNVTATPGELVSAVVKEGSVGGLVGLASNKAQIANVYAFGVLSKRTNDVLGALIGTDSGATFIKGYRLTKPDSSHPNHPVPVADCIGNKPGQDGDCIGLGEFQAGGWKIGDLDPRNFLQEMLNANLGTNEIPCTKNEQKTLCTTAGGKAYRLWEYKLPVDMGSGLGSYTFPGFIGL